MRSKKLVYILNRYSASSTSHFNHVANLLEEMGSRGIEIVLLIEKADDIPVVSSANVRIIALKNRRPFLRMGELFLVLKKLISQGFHHTYIRIAAPAALVATAVHRLSGGYT